MWRRADGFRRIVAVARACTIPPAGRAHIRGKKSVPGTAFLPRRAYRTDGSPRSSRYGARLSTGRLCMEWRSSPRRSRANRDRSYSETPGTEPKPGTLGCTERRRARIKDDRIWPSFETFVKNACNFGHCFIIIINCYPKDTLD